MKLLALNEGLKIIESHQLIPTQINTDSQEIIRMLKENHDIYDGILHDCRYRLRRLGIPVIHHCFREANMVADSLAKMGANSTFFDEARIFEVPPVCVRNALWTDTIGTTVQRSVRSSSNGRVDRTYQVFQINPG
ncbi:hypothetical protein P3S67_008924 [Capsicum chacoense]